MRVKLTTRAKKSNAADATCVRICAQVNPVPPKDVLSHLCARWLNPPQNDIPERRRLRASGKKQAEDKKMQLTRLARTERS